MIVKVKMFAAARQQVNADSVAVELPAGGTVSALRTALAQQHPELGSLLSQSLLAVGEEYASDGTVVSEDVDVALIPPVSGG